MLQGTNARSGEAGSGQRAAQRRTRAGNCNDSKRGNATARHVQLAPQLDDFPERGLEAVRLEHEAQSLLSAGGLEVARVQQLADDAHALLVVRRSLPCEVAGDDVVLSKADGHVDLHLALRWAVLAAQAVPVLFLVIREGLGQDCVHNARKPASLAGPPLAQRPRARVQAPTVMGTAAVRVVTGYVASQLHLSVRGLPARLKMLAALPGLSRRRCSLFAEHKGLGLLPLQPGVEQVVEVLLNVVDALALHQRAEQQRHTNDVDQHARQAGKHEHKVKGVIAIHLEVCSKQALQDVSSHENRVATTRGYTARTVGQVPLVTDVLAVENTESLQSNTGTVPEVTKGW